MEAVCCPVHSSPPHGRTDKIQSNIEYYVWGRLPVLIGNHHLGSTPCFLSGFTFMAFFVFVYDRSVSEGLKSRFSVILMDCLIIIYYIIITILKWQLFKCNEIFGNLAKNQDNTDRMTTGILKRGGELMTFVEVSVIHGVIWGGYFMDKE